MFANLFAARHNKPDGLRGTLDPIGPHNDAALVVMSAIADRTVAAWGDKGLLQRRSAEVVRLLTRPVCLGATGKGQPRHPLYVRGNTLVEPWPVK